VLYAEAAAHGGPLAGRIAGLRSRIAGIVERLLTSTFEGRADAPTDPARIEGIAHAFVGAGESLANWWLDHPEIESDEVAGWLMAYGMTAAGGR
jgi:hypothetical protein